MGNKKTPLIKKLRTVGGTLYVFPSASEDVGLNLQSTTTGVAMSHYALLNIPTLSIQDCMCDSSCTAADGNEALAMSLQNYMMNFETHLTNRDSYNYQELSTVTEKVFWHWAKRIGIIDESKFSHGNTGNSSIYLETGHDTSSGVQDDTVIKVFGSIDAGNSLSTEFGMYNETYINVPTSYGAGQVFLKSSDDVNYRLGMTYAPVDYTHLEGRGDSYQYYSYTNGQDIPFFDDVSTHTYQTVEGFDGLEIVKDITAIQSLMRKQYSDDSLIIGSFDDINIDTDKKFDVDVKFDFNAILLYYSLYDQDDMVKTAYATNLFGIIFLDGAHTVTGAGDGFYIPVKTKMKSTTESFGDSYSFRVNLKTMSVFDNVDAVIQDNTTVAGISAVEFSDAISNLNKAIDIMNTNMHVISAIQDKYTQILAFYDNQQADIDDLSTCINAYIRGTRSAVMNTSTLYVNAIAPNNSSENIYITPLDKTANGVAVLPATPSMTVTRNYVDIPTLNVSTFHSVNDYVLLTGDTSVDSSVMNSSYAYDSSQRDASIAYHTIQKMFNTFSDLLIKVKDDQDYLSGTGLMHNKVWNQLYIDPESPLFDYSHNPTEYNIDYLRDASGNINYVGFIPYLIAQVQKLTQDLASYLK